MLTIFAIPKSFVGHIGIIQRNAIKSWLALGKSVEVLLLGDETGIAAVAAEFNLRHIPSLDRNKFNTPTVSSAFEIAQNEAHGSTMAYVNADIILTSSLLKPLGSIPFKKFLISCQRIDLEVTEELDFGSPDWESRLQDWVAASGKPMGPTGMDCFIFPKGMYQHLPPFGIGRAGWDTWLIYWTRRQRIPVIDATPVATIIHQNHDYSHHRDGKEGVHGGPEMAWNIELAGGWDHIFTLEDATWIFTAAGLKKSAWTKNNYLRRLQKLSELHPRLKPVVKLILLWVQLLQKGLHKSAAGFRRLLHY